MSESVRATFVSSNADLRWEVRQNQETLCTTPCTRWVQPTETLRLRAYGRNGEPSPQGDTVDLPSLTGFAPGQELQVTAEPQSMGTLTSGIVAAGVGGGAIFLGGFLGLFGHIADEEGLATGG
jgi:hypothetical protein